MTSCPQASTRLTVCLPIRNSLDISEIPHPLGVQFADPAGLIGRQRWWTSVVPTPSLCDSESFHGPLTNAVPFEPYQHNPKRVKHQPSSRGIRIEILTQRLEVSLALVDLVDNFQKILQQKQTSQLIQLGHHHNVVGTQLIQQSLQFRLARPYGTFAALGSDVLRGQRRTRSAFRRILEAVAIRRRKEA